MESGNCETLNEHTLVISSNDVEATTVPFLNAAKHLGHKAILNKQALRQLDLSLRAKRAFGL